MRNITLDLLRFVLALVVVAIHGGFWLDVNFQVSFLLIHGAFRVVVPLFFLVSGYYFYHTLQRQRTGEWLRHIMRLYSVWMLLYMPFWLETVGSPAALLLANIQKLLLGYFHLWYLAALLLAAVVVLLLRDRPTRSFVLLGLCLAIAGILLQHYGRFWLETGDILAGLRFSWVSRNGLFFGLPFFLLGFLMHKLLLWQTLSRQRLVWLMLFGITGILVESWLSLVFGGGGVVLDIFVFQYVLAPVIFLLALKTPVYGTRTNLAALSTGIYLVHPGCLAVVAGTQTWGATTQVLVAVVFSWALAAGLLRCKRVARYLL